MGFELGDIEVECIGGIHRGHISDTAKNNAVRNLSPDDLKALFQIGQSSIRHHPATVEIVYVTTDSFDYRTIPAQRLVGWAVGIAEVVALA